MLSEAQQSFPRTDVKNFAQALLLRAYVDEVYKMFRCVDEALTLCTAKIFTRSEVLPTGQTVTDCGHGHIGTPPKRTAGKEIVIAITFRYLALKRGSVVAKWRAKQAAKKLFGHWAML